MPLLVLHMVDRWSPWKPKDDRYPAKIDMMCQTSAGGFERVFIAVKKLVEFAGDRAVIKRGESVQVATEYEDNYFDFVFIDAEHSEAALAYDIVAWYPKVKPGGWLCGHDYGHKRFPGVKIAVGKFIESSGLQLDHISGTCWFIRKRDD